MQSPHRTTIQDSFWSSYQKLVKDVIIPYQWEALNDLNPDLEPTHTIENFRIAAGEAEGEFHGMRFQDSDLAKWLETVGFVLSIERDPNLEKIADEAIELIGRAQHSDGYLNTYFTVAKPGKRWTNLHNDHELYCAGHLIEAAVAYFRATGKTELLDIVCKLADHIDTVFGPEEGKIQGYDAHPEIELALVKLYRVTNNEKYLHLSKFFMEERGKQDPHFFDIEAEKTADHFVRHREKDYSQAHIPIREQKKADGHAVRAMYLYSGMADLALEFNDEELTEICDIIWRNVVDKRMYVTGGVGSQAYGERFTFDYDLPNDRSYTETCAAIGLVFWANRMLKLLPHRQYADIMERALYNGVLSGMSQDGTKYFYVNPLEVHPEACEHRHDLGHVKHNRQTWFGCACCPPNIARLLASLNDYIYSQMDDELYVHLYIGNKASFDVGGNTVAIQSVTNYPWDGNVTFTTSLKAETEYTLGLRLPSWCENPTIKINGQEINLPEIFIEDGYAKIRRVWQDGDEVTLVLPMEIMKIAANPNVRNNIGKVALQRGPIVYCLEEMDNSTNLPNIMLPEDANLSIKYSSGIFEEIPLIAGKVLKYDETTWENHLYQPLKKVGNNLKEMNLLAIPYYLWNNRGSGEMLTWIQTTERKLTV